MPWALDPIAFSFPFFPSLSLALSLSLLSQCSPSSSSSSSSSLSLSPSSVIFLVKFYSSQLDLKKSHNLVPMNTTLLNSSYRWPFILEFLAVAVHIFPGLESLSDSNPSYYLFFTLWMFVRIFLILRVVRYRSRLNSSNGRFIGALTNVEFGDSFILKTILKEQPIPVLVTSLSLLLFISGFCVRMIESLQCATYRDLECIPLSFWDSLWLLVVTTLTIGYGDIVPSTDGGRFVAIVGGLTGTLITAFTIALTADYLQLSRSENKVVAFLKKHEQRITVRVSAIVGMQSAFRYYLARKRGAPASELQSLELHLYETLEVFRTRRRFAKSNDPTDPTDRQLTMLETIDVNLEDIKRSSENIMEWLMGTDDTPADIRLQHTRSFVLPRGASSKNVKALDDASETESPKRASNAGSSGGAGSGNGAGGGRDGDGGGASGGASGTTRGGRGSADGGGGAFPFPAESSAAGHGGHGGHGGHVTFTSGNGAGSPAVPAPPAPFSRTGSADARGARWNTDINVSTDTHRTQATLDDLARRPGSAGVGEGGRPASTLRTDTSTTVGGVGSEVSHPTNGSFLPNGRTPGGSGSVGRGKLGSSPGAIGGTVASPPGDKTRAAEATSPTIPGLGGESSVAASGTSRRRSDADTPAGSPGPVIPRSVHGMAGRRHSAGALLEPSEIVGTAAVGGRDTLTRMEDALAGTQRRPRLRGALAGVSKETSSPNEASRPLVSVPSSAMMTGTMKRIMSGALGFAAPIVPEASPLEGHFRRSMRDMRRALGPTAEEPQTAIAADSAAMTLAVQRMVDAVATVTRELESLRTDLTQRFETHERRLQRLEQAVARGLGVTFEPLEVDPEVSRPPVRGTRIGGTGGAGHSRDAVAAVPTTSATPKEREVPDSAPPSTPVRPAPIPLETSMMVGPTSTFLARPASFRATGAPTPGTAPARTGDSAAEGGRGEDAADARPVVLSASIAGGPDAGPRRMPSHNSIPLPVSAISIVEVSPSSRTQLPPITGQSLRRLPFAADPPATATSPAPSAGGGTGGRGGGAIFSPSRPMNPAISADSSQPQDADTLIGMFADAIAAAERTDESEALISDSRADTQSPR